jgi:phosphoribosylformylglycinamidine cyclo-ligase
MAHVTGGGLTDNLPRVLPRGAHAEIRLGSWPVPELFRLLERHGRVERDEMLRVFNMGVGMVLIVGASAAERIGARLRRAKQRFFTIGRVRAGGRGVDYVAG